MRVYSAQWQVPRGAPQPVAAPPIRRFTNPTSFVVVSHGRFLFLATTQSAIRCTCGSIPTHPSRPLPPCFAANDDPPAPNLIAP